MIVPYKFSLFKELINFSSLPLLICLMNKEHEQCTYKSLTIHLHDKVYEPAEDTFLLLDSLSVNEKNSVCEIGSGTGIIALTCAMKGSDVVCSDINPFAIDLIKKNIRTNLHLLKGTIDVREGNLFNALHQNEQFDIIIFNPPYLPTIKDQLIGDDGWYDKALDGGKSGLEVTIRFLKQVKKYLKKDGFVYFVFSSLSDRSLLERTLDSLSLKKSIINSMRFDDEVLEVFCAHT